MNSSQASDLPPTPESNGWLDLARTFRGIERSDGHRLIYLDNAATTQKPQCVLDAIADYFLNSCANVHRAGHRLGVRATEGYERARQILATFVGAR